jgi:16S rRNA (adenine1518-N6/adenine1519-N6)-dimethyltransferase
VSGRVRRRALGQHFLRDRGVARAIVDALAPRPEDLVVEIGPGEGALTAELAGRSGRLVALEIDAALAAGLRRRFPTAEIVEADARRWNYGALQRPAGGRVLVIGNLPYSVGTAILMTLVGARGAIDGIVVMLQREVAERVAAAPGSRRYGSLSVLVRLGWDARVILRVPPGAFRPPPKVESAVVALTALARPRAVVGDEERFRGLLHAAFAQRRKMLSNGLAASLGLSPAAVREVLEAVGIDPARRAETLDLEEFARLSARLEAS